MNKIVIFILGIIFVVSVTAQTDPLCQQICRSNQCQEVDAAWSRLSPTINSHTEEVFDPNAGWYDPSLCVEVEPITQTSSFAPDVNYNNCRITPNSNSEAIGRSNNGRLTNGVLLTSAPHLSANGGAEDSYGTIELVNLIEYASCYMYNQYNARLSVHDFSTRQGGDFSPPHVSHQNGLDADVAYYLYQNGAITNRWTDVCTVNPNDNTDCANFISSFDHQNALDANWDFVKNLQQIYDIKFIGVNGGVLNLLKQYVTNRYGQQEWNQWGTVMARWPYHEDHFHIRIKCPQGDSQCDGAYDGRASRSSITVPQQLVGGNPDTSWGNSFSTGANLGSTNPACGNAPSFYPTPNNNDASVQHAINNWNNGLIENGFSGLTWVGKLNSNGPTDNNGRRDTGRVTIIFVPCSTDVTREVEVIHIFHGLIGFYEGDMKDRWISQAKQMAQQGRNFVLVFPELPWSQGSGPHEASRSANPRFRGSSSYLRNERWSYASVANDVDQVLTSQLGVARRGAKTFIGHSAGGIVLNYIRNEFNALQPSRIIYSEGDYAEYWKGRDPYTMNIYNDYLKNHPEVIMDMFVQDPNERSGSAHNPTANAIRTVNQLGNLGWTFEYNQGHKVTSASTPGAVPGQPFAVPGHSNIHYIPLNLAHIPIGGTTLSWTPPSGSYTNTPTTNTPVPRTVPSTCTYEDKLAGDDIYDPAGSGCTLCREDKVTRSITNAAGQVIQFQICAVYADQVTQALQNAINGGFPIHSVDGFREGRTYRTSAGPNTAFGQHPYGVAVDINRNWNGLYDCDPQVGDRCSPSHGGSWDPSDSRSIQRNSIMWREMNNIGWHWGGDWTGNQRDMMHFSNRVNR